MDNRPIKEEWGITSKGEVFDKDTGEVLFDANLINGFINLKLSEKKSASKGLNKFIKCMSLNEEQLIPFRDLSHKAKNAIWFLIHSDLLHYQDDYGTISETERKLKGVLGTSVNLKVIALRDELMTYLNFKQERSLYKVLKELIDAQYLERVAPKSYYLNPMYHFKGTPLAQRVCRMNWQNFKKEQ